MDAIKKKMQAMKLEKDNALDRALLCEQQARDANTKAEKAEEEARTLQKKIQTIENDLDQTQEQETAVNGKLEEKEKALQNKQRENKIRFQGMMMIGVLRSNRKNTSRVSNRSSKIQISLTLSKRNSCSKRVKEKENRTTKKASRPSAVRKSSLNKTNKKNVIKIDNDIKMTERSAQGSTRSRRGHQNHPKNMGMRTSNVPTSEIIQALRDGRNLETLFNQQQTKQVTDKQLTAINRNISKLNEKCDDSNKDLEKSNCNLDLINKRNSSSSSLNSTPSEKSGKKSNKNHEGKKKRNKTSQTDITKIARPAADGAEDITDEDDAETAELAKLRCTSERTEVIAEREHRRQKKCADYPGLAFGRSIFSSDSMMKFNIIRNELQNIMNNQLRRAESEVAALNRRIQLLEEDLERSEERLASASAKLSEASAAADESERIRKALENRTNMEDDRVAILEAQLAQAKLIAEEADKKYEEVARKLVLMEQDLERSEEKVELSESKIVELEEELRVVGNNLKSLEVSEEKANQREEEYKNQIKTLTTRLKEAEARAEFAERSVQKLQKEVDRLEDELIIAKEHFAEIGDDLDFTFVDLIDGISPIYTYRRPKPPTPPPKEPTPSKIETPATTAEGAAAGTEGSQADGAIGEGAPGISAPPKEPSPFELQKHFPPDGAEVPFVKSHENPNAPAPSPAPEESTDAQSAEAAAEASSEAPAADAPTAEEIGSGDAEGEVPASEAPAADAVATEEAPTDMDAIKKKMQAMKLEKDNAQDKADTCEGQYKDANAKAAKVEEEVADLIKKLAQIESDLEAHKNALEQANKDLEEKEKLLTSTESEVAALNRKVQQVEEDLEKSEERSGNALAKLLEATQAADENNRMCKVLENRSQQDEERMDQLTNQLKEARLLAEDADGKSDEVSRKLAFVEDELEVAEDRVKSGEAKIMELEEELKVVGNSLKSLEVSEEKANQRVEEFKRQLKSLTSKLKEAENRAELAEKTVKKLQKEVDRLEDRTSSVSTKTDTSLLPTKWILHSPNWLVIKNHHPLISSSSEHFNDDTVCVFVPAVLGLTLAAILAVAACFCARRVRRQNKKSNHEAAFAFQPPPRPARAVRSPNGQTSHYLKKSPSPTSTKPLPGLQSPQTDPLPLQTLTTKYSAENEISNVINEARSSPDHEQVDCGEYGKLGTLVFKLRYLVERNALVVSVVRCRGLPSRNINGSLTVSSDSTNVGQLANGKTQSATATDPYVKLQLLPDKQHKVKTRVVRNTRNPVYEEDFTFYGLTMNELQTMSLHFVVLSFDRYSRDDVIGEVVCPFNTIDLQQIENQQVALSREIQPRSLKIKSQGRGELLISLCWQPAAARLTVVLLKARNLPRMDVTGLADPYVKIYLLYNGQRIAKKKTHVKKRTLSPVFNESFAFDIPTTEGTGQTLEGVSLELMLLDWDRVTKNEVIGRLELGGPRSVGSTLNHWKEVCNSPRRQIADWHKLRE
ncbi:CLUMA_CG005729, isoform F [Clunio marinus]|uniref:CLUMA_CG005729, isoform F n=1 Tax=Clunio marinus TaxID=568069 RepID=A0A1J1HX79_9DIPT|nr:CLUMA_CG005729, isoform F [Clunio marinus]